MKLSRKDKGLAGSIRVAQGTYQKTLLKKFLTQVLVACFGVLLVYLCFAATIIRFVPSSAGVILVKNNTYPGGEIPHNAEVLIAPGVEVGDSMIDRLRQSLIPARPSALVSVKAGPIGEVKWTGGVLSVKGEPLDIPFAMDPDINFLDNQYIGVCISGDCVPGGPVIFSADDLLGVPLKQGHVVPNVKRIEVTGRPNTNQIKEALVGQGLTVEKAACAAKIYSKSAISDGGLAALVNGSGKGFTGKDKHLIDNEVGSKIFFKCNKSGVLN